MAKKIKEQEEKSAGIVYQIAAKNSLYIGKLSNTSYLWDHLNRAISGKRAFTGGSEDAAKWEAEWWSQIKAHGLVKDRYIDYSQCYSVDGVVLYNKIAADLDTIIQENKLGSFTGKQWLSAFQARWGYSDERSVAEALMISLLPRCLNTKIDNMSASEFAAFRQGNITPTTCQSKMDRILDDNKIGLHFFRTITWTQYTNFSQELKKKFEDAFPSFKWRQNSNSKTFTFDLRKHPELVEVITKTFTEATIEEYVKDIQKQATEFHGNSKIHKKLLELADKIAAQPYDSREDIIQDINKFYKENKLKELTRDYKESKILREARIDVDVFCDVFNKWHAIWKSKVSDITKEWIPCAVQGFDSLHNSYKNYFTKEVQSIFEKSYSNEYNEASNYKWDEQTQEGKKHFKHPYQYFNSWLGVKSSDSWLNMLRYAEVERMNFPFLLKNWTEIYSQQVSYWLAENHPDAIVIKHRNEDGFASNLAPIAREITIY